MISEAVEGETSAEQCFKQRSFEKKFFSNATKITQILNDLAHQQYPGRYQSDFAVQVTSLIPGAQQYTTNFTNNNLLGSANAMPSYKTSKARVCVTVGMMTTGYDCPDLLNLALMRPATAPTTTLPQTPSPARSRSKSDSRA